MVKSMRESGSLATSSWCRLRIQVTLTMAQYGVYPQASLLRLDITQKCGQRFSTTTSTAKSINGSGLSPWPKWMNLQLLLALILLWVVFPHQNPNSKATLKIFFRPWIWTRIHKLPIWNGQKLWLSKILQNNHWQWQITSKLMRKLFLTLISMVKQLMQSKKVAKVCLRNGPLS